MEHLEFPETFSSRTRRARTNEPLWLIYRISDGKKNYIGVTTMALKDRWRAHLLGYAYSPGSLQEALRQNPEAFKISVVAEALNGWDAGLKERRFIAEYNSLHPNGYNISLTKYPSHKEPR